MPENSEKGVYASIRSLMAEQLEEAVAGQEYTRAMYDAPQDEPDPPEPPTPAVSPLPEPPESPDMEAAERLPMPAEASTDVQVSGMPYSDSEDAVDAPEPLPEPPEHVSGDIELSEAESVVDLPQEATPPSSHIPEAEPQEALPAESTPLEAISAEELPKRQNDVLVPDPPQEPTPSEGTVPTAEDMPLPAEPEFHQLPDLAAEYQPPDPPEDWSLMEWQPSEGRTLEDQPSYDEELQKLIDAPFEEPPYVKNPAGATDMLEEQMAVLSARNSF